MNYRLWRITNLRFLHCLYTCILLWGSAACTLNTPPPLPRLTNTPLVENEGQPTAETRWHDINYTVDGVCFNAAEDAVDQIFILRSAQEHIRFYDGVDQSQLCRQPIQRHPVNFEGGFVIAGVWNAGRGCTARHDVATYIRHEDARLIVFNLKFITEGDCPYDLIRPFFVGLPDAADYEITFLIESLVSTPAPAVSPTNP